MKTTKSFHWRLVGFTTMLALLLAVAPLACDDPGTIPPSAATPTTVLIQPTAVLPEQADGVPAKSSTQPIPETPTTSSKSNDRSLSETTPIPGPPTEFIEACSKGSAVPDPEDNPGLVQDCAVLLSAAYGLDVNWEAYRPIGDWNGVYTNSGRPRSPGTGTEDTAPTRVSHLELRDGGHPAGNIPPELGNMSSLTTLDLGGNQFTGPIPPELGNMSSLTTLFLHGNQLTGPIPPELGNLSRLTALYFGGNQLTGPIPPELGNMSGLTALYLDENQLTGPIPPELGNLSSLITLDLGRNQVTGAIPPELGNLSNLTNLGLGGNQLTGDIPPELGNLSSLTTLDLGRNQLTGTIPPELGGLGELGALLLQDNGIEGGIPESFVNLLSLGSLSADVDNLVLPKSFELANFITSVQFGKYSCGRRVAIMTSRGGYQPEDIRRSGLQRPEGALKPHLKPGDFLWNHDIESDGYTQSPLAAQAGVVYAGKGGYLYALDAATGERIWRFQTYYTPFAKDGVVYVGSKDHYVYALDAATGRIVWRHRTGELGRYNAPLATEELVFVGTQDGALKALSVEEGELLWSYQLGDQPVNAPAAKEEIVYALAGDGHMYALDVESGEMVWQHQLNGQASSKPVVANDIVYVGSDDGQVVALGSDTGEKIWQYSGDDLSSWPRPLVTGGIVVVNGENDALLALSAVTGALVWKYPRWFQSRLLYAANGIIYLRSEGLLHMLDAETGDLIMCQRNLHKGYDNAAIELDGLVYSGYNGVYAFAMGLPRTAPGNIERPQEDDGSAHEIAMRSTESQAVVTTRASDSLVHRWSKDISISSPPATADGVVYVGTGKSVGAFDGETGESLWRFSADGEVQDPPLVNAGVVYVNSRRGRILSALDSANGDVLRTYEVDGSIVSTPALADGVAYIATDNGLSALDAETGELNWFYPNQIPAWPFVSTPVVFDGIVFTAISTSIDLRPVGRVIALDATTGDLIWKYELPGDVSAVRVADGIVTFLEDPTQWQRDRVIALDAQTGKPVWRYIITHRDADVTSAPTVNAGVVFVASTMDIFALDANSGDYLWSYRFQREVKLDDSRAGSPPWKVTVTAPVAGQRVVYSAGRDNLYALDSATGTPVAKALANRFFGPSALALDADAIYAVTNTEGFRAYDVPLP